MAPTVKRSRPYESPRRREQAAETRRHILDAAEGLFAELGYAATSVPMIAADAQVATKTVYLAFGTKAGIVHALWDVRLGGDDQPIPVLDRPWYHQLLSEEDPARLLRTATRQSRTVKDRAGSVMLLIRHAAQTEPILADLWHRIETEFRTVLLGFARRLRDLNALGNGLHVEEATDLLWTLNHPDTWHLLVRRCGWTGDRYEQWVGDTLCHQLLGTSGPRTDATSASAR